MTSRYSGPEQNPPSSGNGPAYVTHDEFDDFKSNVVVKLASIERAITNDARSRARRDQLITEQLKCIESSQIPQSQRSDPPGYDDLTGRFEIQKKEIVRTNNRRAPVYSGIGAAVAYGVFEGIKLLFQMRGH